MSDRRLNAGRPTGRAAYKVAGVPPDLLRLSENLGQPTAGELASAFYLPRQLTTAFIEFGLARRLWTRDSSGRLHRTDPPSPTPVSTPLPPPGFARTVWTLMQRRDESSRPEPVLMLADDTALETVLRAKPSRLWLVEAPGATPTPVSEHTTRVSADLRYVHGFTFGSFAQVICPPQLGGPTAPVLHTALANLAVHGAAYIGVSLADRERGEVIAALSRIESALIITDLLEEHGTLVFRGVKYPELRGNPEFVRYYVD